MSSSHFKAFQKIEGDRKKGLLIIADHASAGLPGEYGSLGLDQKQLQRHIAYDIGVENVTRRLAEKLNLPAVLSTFSRLLIDPNRGADDPTLVMRISDGDMIPGNARIGAEEIERRRDSYYLPYHKAVADELIAIENEARIDAAAILSIHSFTPVWRGVPRPWEIAILWDCDPRFAKPLICSLEEDDALTVGDNEPYDGALLNDCMFQHGTSKGRAHALVELRQDLIDSDVGAEDWATRLSKAVEPLLDDQKLFQKEFFQSRAVAKAGGHHT